MKSLDSLLENELKISMKRHLPVCIVGSVAYDNLMRFPNKFRSQFGAESSKIDTCFVIDQRSIHYGGTAANLAIGFKKFNVDALIVSKVGEDIDEYCRKLDSMNITTAGLEVVKTEKTLTAFIVTDNEENQITLVHPGAFNHMQEINLSNHSLNVLGVQLVFINPLLGKASRIIAEQCLDLGIPYIFDPGQNIQTIPKQDLLWCARNAKYFIANGAEYLLFREMTGVAESQSQRIAEYVIVTNGREGSILYHEGDKIPIPIVKPTSLIDPTGAGDAYRAGFFSGVLLGYPLDICAKMGALAGTYCVEEAGAQNPQYTYEEFRQRFKATWDISLSLS
jgi:adenosine kinase